MTYRFGPFTADRVGYRVLRGTEAVELTPKLLDLLFHFLDRPATLVTKEELLDAVWPDANVTDNALAQAVSELRGALGDDPASPTYIRTVARRGYRFIAPVEIGAAEARPSAPASSQSGQADHGRVDGAGDRGRDARVESAAGPGIAVLDYGNVTGEPDVAWLSAGIAETVTSDLAALDRFRVVDRWRVVQASRQRSTTGGLPEIASALAVPLVVTGSFQRSGPRLRITTRIVEVEHDETVAEAKIDGALADIFSLQDEVVPALARELRLGAAPRRSRRGAAETSNLDAYRAYTEGWLKIESLDTGLVPAAIADFERAIALDSRYAMAYTGLATAEFEAYEMTRTATEPDMRALASGIEHARHAIRLDDRVAESHATLSLLLCSACRLSEARAAAEEAVALEPDNWRHQYRLGHASWGQARLRAFERALALYPDFAYARLESAMVHVAQGRLDRAEALVREGVTVQDRQAGASDRFPAIGFHWLLGMLLAARRELDDACAEFNRELRHATARRLDGPEYAAAALVGRGHAELEFGRPAQAIASCRGALDHVPGYAPAWLGLTIGCEAIGDEAGARAARDAFRAGLDALARTDRQHDALLLGACEALRHEDAGAALARLDDLIGLDPPSVLGWTLPLEPLLRPLHAHAEFQGLLRRLAGRAQ